MRSHLMRKAILAILWVWLPAAGTSAFAEEPRTLRIGVDTRDAPDWNPLTEFLTERLAQRGIPLRIRLVPASQDENLRALCGEPPALDGAILSPLRYVIADATAVGGLEVLARMRRAPAAILAPGQSLNTQIDSLPGAQPAYTSLIVMRRNAGVGIWPPRPGTPVRFGYLLTRAENSCISPAACDASAHEFRRTPPTP